MIYTKMVMMSILVILRFAAMFENQGDASLIAAGACHGHQVSVAQKVGQ